MNGLIKQADAAKKYWIDNALYKYDYVLLLPHKNERLNTVIYHMLAEKLQKYLYAGNGVPSKKVLVLSVAALKESLLYASQSISDQEAENLLCLYCLYEFTDKLIVGSLELPYGRKAKNLLDAGIASETELVDAVIFGSWGK